MATISPTGFQSWFSWMKFSRATTKQAKDTYKLAERAYRDTNGPTEELRNVYRAYLENKAKSTKRADR